MPKPTIRMPRLLVASFAAVSILASSALAQQAPTARIRGTIEAVDGNMLGIKTREGTDVKVKMTDNVAVFAVVKTELSQIKEGSYIGVYGDAAARRHPEGDSPCTSSRRTSAVRLKVSGPGMRAPTRP